jgi:hypothetical protein
VKTSAVHGGEFHLRSTDCAILVGASYCKEDIAVTLKEYFKVAFFGGSSITNPLYPNVSLYHLYLPFCKPIFSAATLAYTFFIGNHRPNPEESREKVKGIIEKVNHFSRAVFLTYQRNPIKKRVSKNIQEKKCETGKAP